MRACVCACINLSATATEASFGAPPRASIDLVCVVYKPESSDFLSWSKARRWRCVLSVLVTGEWSMLASHWLVPTNFHVSIKKVVTQNKRYEKQYNMIPYTASRCAMALAKPCYEGSRFDRVCCRYVNENFRYVVGALSVVSRRVLTEWRVWCSVFVSWFGGVLFCDVMFGWLLLTLSLSGLGMVQKFWPLLDAKALTEKIRVPETSIFVPFDPL